MGLLTADVSGVIEVVDELAAVDEPDNDLLVGDPLAVPEPLFAES